MKENLFRGKQIYGGRWVEGSLVVFPKTGRAKILVWNRSELEFDEFEVDPDTVGQYCCIVDRNKQMIFEGDILEFNLYRIHFIGYVDFYAGKVGVMCEEGNLYLDDIIIAKEAVKVGNIHDNPELLD